MNGYKCLDELSKLPGQTLLFINHVFEKIFLYNDKKLMR